MSEITSYRDLVTWQKAMDLAVLVYRITATFPKSEQFGLIAQMRDAAVAVPSNVAEGTRHRTPGYISRVETALAEHAELETEMTLSDRVGYVRPEDMAAFSALATQVGELAHGLLRSLQIRLENNRAAEGRRRRDNHKRSVSTRADAESGKTAGSPPSKADDRAPRTRNRKSQSRDGRKP
jgi:four helix bundle protein